MAALVLGGGHNLGPHYWFGWTAAFLRGELMVWRPACLLIQYPCTIIKHCENEWPGQGGDVAVSVYWYTSTV